MPLVAPDTGFVYRAVAIILEFTPVDVSSEEVLWPPLTLALSLNLKATFKVIRTCFTIPKSCHLISFLVYC